MNTERITNNKKQKTKNCNLLYYLAVVLIMATVVILTQYVSTKESISSLTDALTDQIENTSGNISNTGIPIKQEDNVGRIINSLQKKGISNNTIIIFTSDHGDFMGEHRMVRKGMFQYEALLHVPMIWYGPGLFKDRFRIQNLAQSVDIMPTLKGYLNSETGVTLPGRSLKPILLGYEMEENDHFALASALYYDLPEYILNDGDIPVEDKDIQLHSRVMKIPEVLDDTKRTVSIRTSDWRFIKTAGHQSELYKMDGSWIEKENLAEKPGYEELVSSFEKQIDELWPE